MNPIINQSMFSSSTFTLKEINQWKNFPTFQLNEKFDSLIHIYDTDLLKRKIENLNTSNQSTEKKLKMIPADRLSQLKQEILVTKKIQFRVPYSHEYDIIEDLYQCIGELKDYLNKQEFFSLVENPEGVLKKNNKIHHFLVLTEATSTDIKGTVHFSFNKIKQSCSIHGIIIDEFYRRQGYGSLLLVYALATAYFENYKKINLFSGEGNRFFYASFGFKPLNIEMTDEEWLILNFEARTNIMNECMRNADDLTLNLANRINQVYLNNRMKQLQLSFTLSNS
jgi:N-acetylglutamate synthase-like GNAT family acetyltransferase